MANSSQCPTPSRRPKPDTRRPDKSSANITQQTCSLVTLDNGWTQVLFDPYNWTQTFPVLTPGVPVVSTMLIVDELGKYTLDNIPVNGQYAEKPGASH